MIVDTSAIIAILAEEDDAALYAEAIATADTRRLPAGDYLECGIVLDSQRDPVISRGLDELIGEAEFIVGPVTERQARLARQAYADFGKGSGHPAGLTLVIASPTRWRSTDASHSYGKAMTLGILASKPRWTNRGRVQDLADKYGVSTHVHPGRKLISNRSLCLYPDHVGTPSGCPR